MKDKKIVIIPNPINTKVFIPRNKNNAKKSLKLNNKKKVILFGSIDGGQDPRKGADLLIDVLKYLNCKKEDIQIVIFGKKNKYQEIFKNSFFEIFNLGIINSIHKLSTIYSAADLFVIPSGLNPLGKQPLRRKVGTPVAGFDIGGLKDIIDHDKNGILIEHIIQRKWL